MTLSTQANDENTEHTRMKFAHALQPARNPSATRRIPYLPYGTHIKLGADFASTRDGEHCWHQTHSTCTHRDTNKGRRVLECTRWSRKGNARSVCKVCQALSRASWCATWITGTCACSTFACKGSAGRIQLTKTVIEPLQACKILRMQKCLSCLSLGSYYGMEMDKYIHSHTLAILHGPCLDGEFDVPMLVPPSHRYVLLGPRDRPRLTRVHGPTTPMAHG